MLEELSTAISKLPRKYRGDLESILSDLVKAETQRDMISARTLESLADLRLDIQYLMFDNECLRHEAGNSL